MTKSLVLPKLVTAKGVLDAYAHTHGGPVEVRDQLAYHLREGEIRARAWHVWNSVHSDISQAWRNEPDRECYIKPHCTKRKFNLSRMTWWKSVDWHGDQQLWQMRKNRFVISLDKLGFKRKMIRGIGFHGQDLQKCFGDPKSPPSGKRIRADEARQFWHEVIRLIQNGSSDFGLLGTADYRSDDRVKNLIISRLKSNAWREDPEEAAYVDMLEKRAPFKYGDDFVENEVKHLRARFGLTLANIMRVNETVREHDEAADTVAADGSGETLGMP